MRIYASKTRLAALIGVALCAASCARNLKPAPAPHGPPAGIAVVTDAHIQFRANERLELHAMLATAARNDVELPPEFEPSRAPYARVLATDDEDVALEGTIRGLADCAGSGCDLAPLRVHGLEGAFLRAESAFAVEWEKRAAITWVAIERAHAAFDETAEGVLQTLAKELGVTWSATPSVDLVAESPPAGRKALLTPFLSARGACFESRLVNNTRIVDCVVVRGLLSGKRPEGFSERFFTVLVVHAVAAVMTKLDAKHESVDRRAVAAVEPEMLAFITTEWHGGAVTPDLEERYQAAAKASAPDPPASH